MLKKNKNIILGFFAIGFLIGILYNNLSVANHDAVVTLFGKDYLNQYLSSRITNISFGLYLLKIRICPILFLLLIRNTKGKKILVAFFLLWTGFLGGILMTSAVIDQGIKGLLFSIVLLLPQIICYLFGYLILFLYIYDYPNYHLDQKAILIVFMLICAGIVLEIYINPILVKFFAKIV